MPRKDNFGEQDYDLEEIINAMHGGTVNQADDGDTIILDNPLLEVMAERLDDDGDQDRVTIVYVDAEAEADIRRFADRLAE